MGKKAENVLPCPVCREDMPKELWNIPTLLKEQDGTLQSNEANTGVFVKTWSLQKLQRKMTVLYEKQKEKGALVQNNFSSGHFATPSNYFKIKSQLYINLFYY